MKTAGEMKGTSFSMKRPGFSMKSTGFSVKGTGFSMKRPGFSVKGTGFSVKGTGFSVKGTGFSMKGTGFSMKSTGFSVKGTGFSMKRPGFSMKGTGFSMKGTGFSPYIHSTKMKWALAPEGNFSSSFTKKYSSFAIIPAFLFLLPVAPQLHAQAADAEPIAIVTLDTKNPDVAAKVTGALEVSQNRAIIAASGTVTSGSQTTEVILPHRGTLRVCASTTVKLAADTSVPAGETPGLMMALDHGAIEISFATSFAKDRNADILLTPDFRILIGAPGAAEVKVRLGQHGDTCVDNAGTNAPYVLVSSVFDGGDYRVQPGQRVMFEHGSLREAVDNEKEPCGCPPPLKPGTNDFPLAQSAGLAPLPEPAPNAAISSSSQPQVVESLIYNSADHAPKPAAETAPAASASANPTPPPAAKKKPSFFSNVGKFFRRIFGAE